MLVRRAAAVPSMAVHYYMYYVYIHSVERRCVCESRECVGEMSRTLGHNEACDSRAV
jgi:hypothetical protein